MSRLVLLLCALGCAAARPPNVLFIAVDDLRPELGVYGRPEVRSPHIDRLGREGVVFEHAYAQQAVCSPSRTSLLTGLRPDATRVYDLETHFRETVGCTVTLPQYFKQHGYHTEWYGKLFHARLLDDPSWTQQGERLEPDDNWRAYAVEENKRMGAGPPYENADVADDTYPDGKIANRGIEALRRIARWPFFLALGFYKPHLPFTAPKRYWDLYDPSAIALPARGQPPDGAPRFASSGWGELRSYAGVPREGPVSPELARTLIHGYRAAVSYTDAQVGRVLAELDRLGLRDQTIVVLWGDHGWKLGEYGQWAKHTNFELDTRVPLLVRAPGVQPARTAALVELVDLYPTLVELAGLPAAAHLQGTSLVPLLREPARPWKVAALSQYPRPGLMGRSMRTEHHRFTRWESPDGAATAYELYDQRTDAVADTNLADAEPATVKKLDALLTEAWGRSLATPPCR